MTTLQELITRGRFVMSDAPSRLKVFEAVDGRRTTREIALAERRHENNVRRDLAVLRDAGLVQPKLREDGGALKRDGLPVYERVPLARTIPVKYFQATAKRPESVRVEPSARRRRSTSGAGASLMVPSETDILAIASYGEDQLYEFKAPGTDISKVVRELGAMLNTSRGGILLYGIEDDGTIVGAGVSRQDFDQPLQNSVKNSIAPAAVVQLHGVAVLGSEVLVVIVPAWNRRDVYQVGDRILIRKGTNVFAARPEEVRMLHRGEAVI